MAKARSPAYPAISLREAIEKIRLVYEKDYQNKIPRALVAEHMGYRSLNGKSLGVLSAVAKYGLLEGRAQANWVSDLALAIIAHSPGTPERMNAIAEAARQPNLFAELDSRFENGKASDAAIRSYLMTRKFIPYAADAALRSYRETKELVAEEGPGYNEKAVWLPESESPTMHANVHESKARMGERELLRGPLSREANFRLIVSGKIGVKEIDRLIQKLQLDRDILADTEGNAEEND